MTFHRMQATNIQCNYLFKLCQEVTPCININEKYSLINYSKSVVTGWCQTGTSTLSFKFFIKMID